jgi:arabinose-5-phosphate isomerase
MSKIREVAIKCLEDEAQTLLDQIPFLDENFDRVVELIYDCKGKVVVTGVGKSGHVGAKIAATLSSTGTPAFYISPLDLFHGDLGVITPEDVVLALSYSGQTDELLRLIPFLLEQKTPLVGISGNPTSLLAKYSTYHLGIIVRHEACPLNLAPTSSTTATLALGDALACALMEMRGFKANDFARFHPGGSLGKRLLTTAHDVMRTEELPVVPPTMPMGEAVFHVSKGRLGLCVAMVDDKVTGIITDGDVRRAMENSQDKFFHLTVGDVMTLNPKCVSAQTKISAIQQMMGDYKIHAVLVVDEEKHLLGIVDHFRCML